MKFEDRITASAQRMVAEQDSGLRVPQNPLRQDKHYWGWVATPAAAVIGIVFGLSVQHFVEKTDDSLTQVVDTVFVPQVQHDTLRLTQVETQERVVEKTIWREKSPSNAQSNEPVTEKEEESVCTSVSCDGINYGILASN